MRPPFTFQQLFVKGYLPWNWTPRCQEMYNNYHGPCAAVYVQDRVYLIREEHCKGLGLFTTQDLQRGDIVGKYEGQEHTDCHEGQYVMNAKAVYIDGAPHLKPAFVNGIPIGNHGRSVLAYINEPCNGETTNVAYQHKTPKSVIVVAIRPIPAWTALLACYNCPDSRFTHNCRQCECDFSFKELEQWENEQEEED